MLNLRHVTTNTLGSVLPIAIILVSIPLYLRFIGAEKYGILSMVWIVFGYLGVLDLGVGKATTSAVSRAGQDPIRRAEAIWSASGLALLVGLAVGLVAWAAVGLTKHLWESPALMSVMPALPFLALGIPVVTTTSALAGALDGDSRFKTANSIQVIATALYQLVPLAVAYALSQEITVLIGALIMTRLFVLVLYATVCAGSFGLVHHVRITRDAMRDLVRFGAKVAAINTVDPIFNRVDQLLVGRFAGPESVAAYSVAINSVGRLGIVPMAMSRSIFPSLAARELADSRDDLLALRARVFLPWLALCAASILASDVVFRLWLQDAISTQVSAVAKAFIPGLWASCLSILPYTALQATGRSGSILKVHLLEMPFYLLVLVLLTQQWGAVGAAVAFGLRNVLDHLLLWRLCGLQLRRQGPFFAALASLTALAWVA